MRWADLVAFFTSAMWFGSYVAIAILPAPLFKLAKARAIDATAAEVGEVFGQIVIILGVLSLGLLALLGVARLAGWIIRLRQRDFRRSSLIGVLLFAAIAVFALLAVHSYEVVEAHRTALDNLEESSPERPVAAALFDREHQRSRRLSEILTVLLFAQSLALAVSLGCRRPSVARAAA